MQLELASTRAPPSRRLAWPLVGLLLAALALRAGAIERPLVGYFATKNVVYAMIARHWARGEASWNRPTLDVLQDGRPSWHLLEVPVAAYVAGSAWKWCGGTLDVWGRLVSIGCGVTSVALLFLLVRRWHGESAAWGASVALALSPVSVIFGGMFMLEASVVCGALLTAWCVERVVTERRWSLLVLAGAAFAIVTLTKIYMLALLLPLGVRVFSASRESPPSSLFTRRDAALVIAVLIVSTLPAIAWVVGVHQVCSVDSPDAERVFYSLFDSTAVHRSAHGLLLSADFYRRLLDDLAGIVLTPLGVGLLLIGATHSAARRHWPWLAMAALLVVALPRKFYELPYYYLPILPGLCFVIGLGWERLQTSLRLSNVSVGALLLVSMTFTVRYAAGPAWRTPVEDQGVISAAQAAALLLAPHEPVATLHGSTLDLLYYCDRSGWALDIGSQTFAQDLNAAVQGGARHLVVANLASLPRHPDAERVVSRLPLKQAGLDYRIYDLTADKLPAGSKPLRDAKSTTIPAAPGIK